MYRGERAAPFRTTGICLYRTGDDSVAWHGDTIGRRSHDETLVAIVSLGAPRRLLLRPKGGGRGHRFSLGHGDLLVMGGTCQRTWEHSVPKTARPAGGGSVTVTVNRHGALSSVAIESWSILPGGVVVPGRRLDAWCIFRSSVIRTRPSPPAIVRNQGSGISVPVIGSPVGYCWVT